MPIKSIIIEGVDRLGKDTLIAGIKNRLGNFQTIHYQKPELLDCYVNDSQRNFGTVAIDDAIKSSAVKCYQVESFRNMFHLLSSGGRFILNRAHLGEVVYAPRYRKYDGSYVFDLENRFINDEGSNFHKTTLLVLLHTSSFDFIKDDGLSFNFDKKEEEQFDFVRAFERSEITHKLMIDVNDGAGGYVPSEKILAAVVQAYQELPLMQHPILNVSWTRDENGDLQCQNYLQPDPKKLIS